MSGFEAKNPEGSLIVSSDQKHTIFHSIYEPVFLGGSVGDYTISTAFGNFNQLVALYSGSISNEGYLYWVQFKNPNNWGYPGFNYFIKNSIRVIRTSRNLQHQSGFLDVFDGEGNLIWSAKSASTMPRVRGILTVPTGYDLTGRIVSSPALEYNPFFLWNACVGEISDDGVAPIGYSGNLVRWNGTQLQISWMRSSTQMSYLSMFGSGRGGFKLPYATFLDYP